MERSSFKKDWVNLHQKSFIRSTPGSVCVHKTFLRKFLQNFSKDQGVNFDKKWVNIQDSFLKEYFLNACFLKNYEKVIPKKACEYAPSA